MQSITESAEWVGDSNSHPAPPAGRQGHRRLGRRRPHAAERQRAVQEGRRRPQRPGAHRDDLRQARASTRSPATTCAAACAGGASTPSASPASTAARPPSSSRSELDDEYFMLRVRIDGGPLSTAQLRTIAEISNEFARGTADITDRQNIQLHWIRIEDVPEIWRRLEAVGLSTAEACGDTPRVILGSPVAGIAADEIIDGTPPSSEILDRYIGSPRVLQPAAQVQDRDLRLAPASTSRTRSTTSRSSASSTPSTAPASTCGSAAACRPTRCSPSGSAPGSPSRRSPRSGRASSRSSATTATAGCATAPG